MDGKSKVKEVLRIGVDENGDMVRLRVKIFEKPVKVKISHQRFGDIKKSLSFRLGNSKWLNLPISQINVIKDDNDYIVQMPDWLYKSNVEQFMNYPKIELL